MAKTDRMAHARMLLEHDQRYTGVVLAGIDEVGRGPLAGNVVVACVVMPAEPLIPWVDRIAFRLPVFPINRTRRLVS